MIPSPVANPSKPSIKLNALITDTIKNTVKKIETILLSKKTKLKGIYCSANIINKN